MYQIIIVYDWPWSQICMDCKHGEFVMSETRYASNYICKVNATRNTGTECPHMVKKMQKPQAKEVMNEPYQ